MNATTGSLQCGVDTNSGFNFNSNRVPNAECSNLMNKTVGLNTAPDKECATDEYDDGYLGGQEWDDGSCGDLSLVEEGESSDARNFSINPEDCAAIPDCGYEKENGWNIEFELDEYAEEVNTVDDVGTEDAGRVQLGDCRCIAAEDNELIEDDIDDVSSGDNDSEDSTDEDDVSVEIDVEQEIYIDQSQIGAPYKKRYVPKKRPSEA